MRPVTDFCSGSYYIALPLKSNPKVILAVDNSKIVGNSFKLYNPFSSKAKLLKLAMQSLFCFANLLAKQIFRLTEREHSPLLSYLEKKLDNQLISSIYIATVKDKVVLQLQTPSAEIVGYLKYPLNEIGVQNLENEKKAIDLLATKKIVPNYLLYDSFEDTRFLLLSPLEGKIGLVGRDFVNELLQKLKREERYTLREHPRVRTLQMMLIEHDLPQYSSMVQSVSQQSTNQYALVYEHGDFTPWNIAKVNNDYIPFDLEHFVEDGLEYFDLIKYYYQIGKLLEGQRGDELIEQIQREVDVPEVLELLQLFLIKEIMRCLDEDEPFDVETELLELVDKR